METLAETIKTTADYLDLAGERLGQLLESAGHGLTDEAMRERWGDVRDAMYGVIATAEATATELTDLKRRHLERSIEQLRALRRGSPVKRQQEVAFNDHLASITKALESTKNLLVAMSGAMARKPVALELAKDARGQSQAVNVAYNDGTKDEISVTRPATLKDKFTG